MSEKIDFNQLLPFMKQLNPISDSVILEYPITMVQSDAGDITMRFNFEKLGVSEFPTLPLMNSVGSLTTILELFGDERDVDLNGDEITIKEGKRSSSFITDNLSLMGDFDIAETQMNKAFDVVTVADVILSVEDNKKIRSATSAFKELEDVVFTSKDGEVDISLGALNKFNARSDRYSINCEGETSQEFSIGIPVDNFKRLPLTEYRVLVKYNSAVNAYRIMFISTQLDGNLEIMLAVKIV